MIRDIESLLIKSSSSRILDNLLKLAVSIYRVLINLREQVLMRSFIMPGMTFYLVSMRISHLGQKGQVLKR